MRKLSTEEFVSRSNIVHHFKYTYHNAQYVSATALITITCPKHGDFRQIASYHLSGSGCLKCTGRGLSLSDFIEKANEIHHNRYDYLLATKAKNVHSKTQIICPTHGVFAQSWSNHINNAQGCPQCGIAKQTLSRSKTTCDFVKEAKEIHGDRYDYSETVYTNAKTKVRIKCLIHGFFDQPPFSHLGGRGCRRCSIAKSKIEKEWLDSINVNERQYLILIGSKRYLVDGFDASTNTVYEFHGDYWHGNPEVYDSNTKHPLIDKTFGQLYEETLQREEVLRKAGFTIISIWESDWRKLTST